MIYDYDKYKRVFAFGCSFTGYRYPTWANIMSEQISQADFYNLARSGGGNTFIANRLTEANKIYNFCETDLVMVMWSTFCREDRYHPERGWVTPGNIYSQNEYDFTSDNYLVNWGDPLTYLVRDLSIIDMTNTYLDNLPCDTLKLLSVPFSHQQELNNDKTKHFLNLYQELENSLPDNLFDLEMNGTWTHGSQYIDEHTNELFQDYHPSPLRYANYLKKIGIELSDKAYQFAVENTVKLQEIKHGKDFLTTFSDLCDPRLSTSALA